GAPESNFISARFVSSTTGISTLPALSDPSTASPVSPALFASAAVSAALAFPVTTPSVAIPRSAAARVNSGDQLAFSISKQFTGVDSTSFNVAGSFENQRAGTQSGMATIATAAKSSILPPDYCKMEHHPKL